MNELRQENEFNAGCDTLLRRNVELYPAEVTSFLDTLAVSDILDLLDHIPQAYLAKIVEQMNPDVASQVLIKMEASQFSSLIPTMDPSISATLLSRISKDIQTLKLALLPKNLADELKELMQYPADSAGAVMESRVIVFKKEEPVENVFVKIRTTKTNNITHIFVVDEQHRLVGQVPLTKIITVPNNTRLEALCTKETVWVSALSPQTEVVDILKKTRLSSIAVLDADERLVGVIRYNALISVIEKDASVDIQKMFGVSAQEKALSRFDFAVKKRLPWLYINLLTAFLASYVVGLFEGTIAKFTALAILLPVVAGQSGNTGAQALAVIQRGLVLREIRLRHAFRVIFKESTVGLINGVCIGIACAAGVYLWSKSFGLALVICISMIIAMIAAGFSGAAIPLVLTALKQDPAQASSIILTTITDVVGFLTFLGLATVLSHLLVT